MKKVLLVIFHVLLSYGLFAGFLPIRHTGNIYILSVGNNDYPWADSLNKFSGEQKIVNRFERNENNAKRISDSLQNAAKSYDGSKCKSFVLLGKNASKRTIMDTLAKISKMAVADDCVVFSFCGLGYTNRDKKESYLVPNGGIMKNVEINLETVISVKELSACFEKIFSKKQMFIIEADAPNFYFTRSFLSAMDIKKVIMEDAKVKNRVFINFTNDESENLSGSGIIVDELVKFPKNYSDNLFLLFSRPDREKIKSEIINYNVPLVSNERTNSFYN